MQPRNKTITKKRIEDQRIAICDAHLFATKISMVNNTNVNLTKNMTTSHEYKILQYKIMPKQSKHMAHI